MDNGWTGQEVVAALEQQGYSTTERRLTAWVQKGLLPERTPRGLGRGKGKWYVWEQGDIVAQAVAVHDLYAWYGRVDGIRLPLWLLGFAVPLSYVRADLHWHLDTVARDAQEIAARARTPEACADAIFETIEQALCRRRSRGGRSLGPICLSLLLNAYVNPAYSPTADELSGALDEVRDTGLQTAAVGMAPLEKMAEIVRTSFSVTSLREALDSASDEDLWCVQHDLALLGRCLNAHCPIEDEKLAREVMIRVVAALGPWLALVDLSLRRAGNHAILEQFIRACEEMTEQSAASSARGVSIGR